jgi:hypothetical protein
MIEYKDIKHINSLNELAHIKKRLKKKIYKAQKRFRKDFRNLYEFNNTESIFETVLDQFGIKNVIIKKVILLFIKYKNQIINSKMLSNFSKKQKKVLVFSLIGVSLGVVGYLYYKHRKDKKLQEQLMAEEKKFVDI